MPNLLNEVVIVVHLAKTTFIVQESMQNLNEPSFLGTVIIWLLHSLDDGHL